MSKTLTYMLTNMIKGDTYVGVTSDKNGLTGRCYKHANRANRGQHNHLPLYKNINEYGWTNFRSQILCEGDDEEYYCWLMQPTLNQCWMGRKPVSQTQVEASRKARNKPVRCVETGVVYENARVIDLPGVSWKGVSAVCLGKRQTHGGYHWEFVNGK